jgi:hypothetical protein
MTDRSAVLLRAARAAARLMLPIDEATEHLLAAAAEASELDLAAAITAAERLPTDDADAARARTILRTAREVRLFPAA